MFAGQVISFGLPLNTFLFPCKSIKPRPLGHRLSQVRNPGVYKCGSFSSLCRSLPCPPESSSLPQHVVSGSLPLWVSSTSKVQNKGGERGCETPQPVRQACHGGSPLPRFLGRFGGKPELSVLPQVGHSATRLACRTSSYQCHSHPQSAAWTPEQCLGKRWQNYWSMGKAWGFNNVCCPPCKFYIPMTFRRIHCSFLLRANCETH